MQVVLRKLGRGSRAVVGRLVRAPRKGSVVVIEFSDGMHDIDRDSIAGRVSEERARTILIRK